MKKIILILIAITTILTVDVFRSENESIIIYSSMELYRTEELQNQLDERFPNNNIIVMYVPTSKAASKIKLEKTKSDASIVVGLETSYLEMVSESLEDLSDFKTENYVSGLSLEDNNYKYVTWEKQAGCFVVNRHVLDEKGLSAPTSYQELLNPIYKNLIAMPDPKSSGTGYFFYKGYVNNYGDDAALAYFDELAKNIKSFTESGSGPIKLLKQEEVAIGLGLTFQSVTERNEGQPFEIIFPQEGSPYSLTGTAIIKGKRNDLIDEIFDFIIHDFFLYDKANFSPETVIEDQAVLIENYPENIHYANMDGIEKISEKERLLSLWKY